MSRQAALSQYLYARKLAQKYYKACTVRGQYPYTQVLNEVFSENAAAGRVNVGLVDIPMELIVGSTTAGRRSAFAGNFMPMLDESTEFADKWIHLCHSHLDGGGISDPIVCCEYLGKFYVVEGNKRVSVLKSYDSPSIPGYVTRILPPWSEDETVQIYYEFLPFYQLSGLYNVTFTSRGSYEKLQARLGFEKDHVWTDDERSEFLFGFRKFKEAFEKVNAGRLEITAGDALLVWLQMNPPEDLQHTDLVKSLQTAWPDVTIFANGSAISLSTSPQTAEKPDLTRMLGFGRVNHLKLAFIYAYDPLRSSWTAAHETGRKLLEAEMGDRISTQTYYCGDGDPLQSMEQAVADGAQMIFATTPPMIGACRQIAAKHPHVKVLNCSLSMPYAGVRTYYSRIFESKFITGAVVGAMTKQERIGYVANYPILGTVAAINAFALGARMTNPRARISLRWSCLPGNPVRSLLDEGITVISNRDSDKNEPHWAWEWGTYSVEDDGSLLPLASPRWNWGKFYEGVVQSVFDGSWNALSAKNPQAVNYWWGMSSGVIDVSLSPALPEGAKQLARLLKQGVVDGSIDPFRCVVNDQQGQLRIDGESTLSAEEIIHMDWLAENVDGIIPEFDDILPVSQQMVRLLGIRRNEIKPQPEEVIL